MNTILCKNWSTRKCINNNNINITASCLHADFSRDDLYELHVVPYSWKLLFEQNDGWKIRPIVRLKMQYANVTTCMRVAFKAVEMGLIFEFET